MSDSKIMSDSHWLGRIRDLMQQVGMPDSQPLYLAFTQLMFEMQRAALAAAPRAAQEPAECDWWLEDAENMPDTYRTGCGRIWSFVEGNLADNGMHFCMGCGKKAKEVALEGDDEDADEN